MKKPKYDENLEQKCWENRVSKYSYAVMQLSGCYGVNCKEVTAVSDN